MDRTIIVKSKAKYMELPYGRDWQLDDDILIHYEEDNAYVNNICLSDKWQSYGSYLFRIFEKLECYFSFGDRQILRIGSDDRSDITFKELDADLFLSHTFVNLVSGTAYLNGVWMETGRHSIKNGDCILVGECRFYLENDLLVCDGTDYKSNLLEVVKRNDIAEDYPQYKRTPRIIRQEPTERVDIKEPPGKAEKRKGAWITILMPLVMVCVTVTMGLVMGRGLMVLMSAVMMTASAVFAIVRLVTDKRSMKEKEIKRVTDYKAYLLDLRKRLYGLNRAQIESRRYHFPAVGEIGRLISERSGRIYERAANDADFLCVSIGQSIEPSSYQLKYNNDRLQGAGDELLREMQEVATSFITIKDMPTVIDLKKTHLAYVGEKSHIHAQLRTLVAELSFFQSYHDLNIVLLTDETSASQFSWMRWLPHCRLQSINTLAIISTENHRDKVLGNITSVLKERKMNKDEQKKNSVYLPHYVFIIDNPKLILSHSIMEYLQSSEAEIGFSVIYTTPLKANVPENIKTVMLLDGKDRATLLLKEGSYLNQEIRIEAEELIDYEAAARGLCPLIHNKGVTTQIPSMLTFFDMYGVKQPQELPIEDLWKNNVCHKSLAVPLGARAKEDYVYLNLHEKAHGPHGLIAGTTGSGKSEAMQSFILSLAVNFHPYDVGFLLIDYKGGGMAKLFERLPHLLGTITNLDGSESMRALASIKSELARRQRVFNDHSVNNINDYTKLFKSGTAKEPLPHLFIVSDEFAELKKEQPDFMKELVSAARIGRSLGVHLILATQKPTGVVDDQIWSNSRFKLALKVQNESDSNEILKTPDAARITQTGRAYLQIGNNEIYELFQTAWSGAPYKVHQTEFDFDERVYLENESGQGELLNPDVFGGGEESSMITQLDVTVEHICDLYEKMNLKAVEKPWMPPLAEKIVSPHIKTNIDVARYTEYQLSVPLGIVDIPEKQAQEEFYHNFIEDGNMGFFGASGYGKSVSMMTVSLELATRNSPDLVHLYILDFGNSALIQLKGLPHTADYMTYDDTEKLRKFIKRITDEIAIRKRLFAKANAVSFLMYNKTAEKKLPAIFVEIDNYDVIKELTLPMDEFIIKMTRDGNSVGIYTVMAASRTNAVRYSTLNNFKNKIAFYAFDIGDLMAAVGRSQYVLPEMRGRALVKLKEPHIMQCYLPVEYENDASYATLIGDTVRAIKSNCSVAPAIGIPVLPETVTYEMLTTSTDARKVAVGLDADSVKTRYLDLSNPVQLIIGASQTGKTNMLKLICSQLNHAALFISDSRSMELNYLEHQSNVSVLKEAADFLARLDTLIAERRQQYEKNGSGLIPRDFFARLSPLLLILDDVDYFLEIVKGMMVDAEKVVMRLSEVGGCIVATTTPSRMRAFDNITKYLKETQAGIVLGNPSEQSMLDAKADRTYKMKMDMGFLIERGASSLVMIPEANGKGKL